MSSAADTRRPVAVDFESVVARSQSIEGLWRSALEWGDRLIVITLNSIYSLYVIDDDQFIVTGGWFDRKQSSPAIVRIAGCSWGGSAINRKLVAAPGLHLEFGNGVVTTPIQRVILTRREEESVPN